LNNKRSPSAERLHRARKAAARELKLPPGDWRTRRYALLMVAHDNVTARLANGADVSVDNLLKIDAAMQEIRASTPQEPIAVTVTFVDGVETHESPELPPTPTPSPPAPPPTSPPSDPATSNVVPLRPAAEADREAVLRACAPPLKRYQGDRSWRSSVAPNLNGGSYGNYNPFGVGGDRPNFEQHHPLPIGADE